MIYQKDNIPAAHLNERNRYTMKSAFSNKDTVSLQKQNLLLSFVRKGDQDKYAKIILMGPAITFLTLLLFFPIIYTIWQSMFDVQLANRAVTPFVGLGNYLALIRDSAFWRSIFVTFYFTALVLLFETIFGIALALLYNKEFFGRGVLRTLAIMPMAATPVSIALIFVMIFNPTIGLGNFLLGKLGLGQSLWVYSGNTVIPSLALIDIWQWTPLILIIALAGLASLPTEVYESAKIDGASSMQRFLYITMPLLWPFIASGIIFRINDALKTFDIIYVITQGGPGDQSTTLNISLYNQAFIYYHVGLASAESIIFFLIILATVWYFIRSNKREKWN